MIGILGGTFDPVHNGHVQIALDIHHALELEQIRLIPCNVPPHRNMPVANAEQRLAMLQLVTVDHDELSVDTRELEREGPSWMVDTLTSLRNDLGNTPLCFIVGVDAFNHIDTWHEWQKLISLAHIVIADRPDCKLAGSGTVAEFLKQNITGNKHDLLQQAAGLIYRCPVTQVNVSSTSIRNKIHSGDDADNQMPEKVWAYIQKQAIYK
ncbi:MAG: nicotinate-nucleotide adenylyltransferase [Gammaproteobacteria bacterium]|nr:nicotinate-nucleotide adenylyltransferase [Gammaproteobacteria bacterium]MDH5593875.1 nicotinate-nucleotide adenylyltransferase [Gammaproteobacteria bacterium]MDH5614291.1 nicotinate-nucleotide adenylyltransferase [Gammaproteobacteria bacterium]